MGTASEDLDPRVVYHIFCECVTGTTARSATPVDTSIAWRIELETTQRPQCVKSFCVAGNMPQKDFFWLSLLVRPKIAFSRASHRPDWRWQTTGQSSGCQLCSALKPRDVPHSQHSEGHRSKFQRSRSRTAGILLRAHRWKPTCQNRLVPAPLPKRICCILSCLTHPFVAGRRRRPRCRTGLPNVVVAFSLASSSLSCSPHRWTRANPSSSCGVAHRSSATRVTLAVLIERWDGTCR